MLSYLEVPLNLSSALFLAIVASSSLVFLFSASAFHCFTSSLAYFRDFAEFQALFKSSTPVLSFKTDPKVFFSAFGVSASSPESEVSVLDASGSPAPSSSFT
jgi:hypothetical protein